MNPWDEFAAKFGEEEATRRLGPRPTDNKPDRGFERDRTTPQQAVESIAGPLNSIAEGATFGLQGEVGAGLRALGAMVPGGKSPREAWNESLDKDRQTREQFAQEHPVANVVGQVGGGILSGGAVASALKKTPVVGRLLGGLAGSTAGRRAATVAGSGAAGGVAAFGATEGGVRDRLQAVPAGIGWGLGGAALMTGGAKAAGAAADVLDVRTPDGVRQRARDILLNWMRKDQLGVDDVADASKRLRGPATVAESGGPNVQRLVGTIESKPGAGAAKLRGLLTARQGQAPKRIGDAVRKAAGGTADDLEGALERMTAAQRAKAAPLYQQVKEYGEVADDEVTRLLSEPRFREAYDRAREILRIGDETDLPELFDESGKVVGRPTLEALDLMKRQLDRSITRGFDGSSTGERDVARALSSRLGRILDRLDEEIPVYGQARATWRGDEAAKEAFEEGYSKFRAMEPEALERRMSSMPPSRRDPFRLGVMRYLREQAGDVTERPGSHDLVGKIMGSGDRDLWAPGSERKVRALFQNDGELDEFLSVLESEGKMSSTFRQMSGSRTVPLAESGAELDRGIDAAVSAGRAAQGDVSGFAGLLRAIKTSRAAGLNERTMSELADMLTAGISDPADLSKLLEELRRAESAARGSAAAGGAIAGGLRAGG